MKSLAIRISAMAVTACLAIGYAQLHSAPPSNKPRAAKPVSPPCSQVGGNYDVTKLIKSLDCQSARGRLQIPDWQNAMAETSKLAISHGDTADKCKFTAVETITGSNLKISYAGATSSSSMFSFSNQNPDSLSLPLKMTVNNKYLTCNFKGTIDWSATIKGKGFLRGTISFKLTGVSGEPGCPNACTMVSEYDATNPN